jgi:hypothetical protein
MVEVWKGAYAATRADTFQSAWLVAVTVTV